MAQINFKGKSFVQNYHLLVKYHQLIADKKKSATKSVSLKDNLILHGDNLAGLKALLPLYTAKIKCIFIDPPYNTGNEGWAYNDNVTSPMMQEWLGKVVERDDLTRHDKWLCMLMPRLRLLKELLRSDGAIFITIDDNEVHHLRMLMDEIFGEENFVTQIEWQKRYTRSNNTDDFTSVIDHIVVYAKSSDFRPNLLERDKEANERYSNPDNDPRGDWKPTPFLNQVAPEKRPNLCYEIINPKTGKKTIPGKKAWRYERLVYEKLLKEKRLWWGKSGVNPVPDIKTFLSEVRQGMTPINFWDHGFAGHTDDANQEIKEIFGSKAFDTPKPTKLIKRILEIATLPNENHIVLDSFAGSGTTGHAVLALNKENKGNRKFILIESQDYADKLTAERIRRVIEGVGEARDPLLQSGLGGSFSYFTLGEPISFDKLLNGKDLPKYQDLARYLFYTSTGEEFNEKTVSEKNHYIGSSKSHEVYLYYKADVESLKNMALTLSDVRQLSKLKSKRFLIFAPTKYLDQEHLDKYKIDFVQLPYEIYKAFG